MSIVFEHDLGTSFDWKDLVLDSPDENSNDKFVSNDVYAGQWSAQVERDGLFLGSYETRISVKDGKCLVDNDTLQRLEYALVSNPNEKVQFSLRARFPMAILESNYTSNLENSANHTSSEATKETKHNITSEILRNAPSSTFYSYANTLKSTNKIRLQTAIVNVFGGNNLQINFDSGEIMEVPLKHSPKKIWALDIGMLIEVEITEFFGINTKHYYTVVHPLNGMQIFNLDASNTGLDHNGTPLDNNLIKSKLEKIATTIDREKKHDFDTFEAISNINSMEKSPNSFVSLEDNSLIRRSTFNQYTKKWQILQVTEACDLNSPCSNRIIIAFDIINKKHAIFSYRYVWEDKNEFQCRHNHCCWKIGNACMLNRKYLDSLKFEKEHMDFTCFDECPQSSCFPVNLRCRIDDFPSEPSPNTTTVLITNDRNYSPIIWFLVTSMSRVSEVNKYVVKRGNKRMSIESPIKTFSHREIFGYKPDNIITKSSEQYNNTCTHEWKLIINLPISEAIEIKCTSQDRYDLLLLIPGNRLFLWTGYNELVPCVVTGELSKVFMASDEISSADILSIKDTTNYTPIRYDPKNVRSRNSDILPRIRKSIFKLPRMAKNDSMLNDIKLMPLPDYKVRIYTRDVFKDCLQSRVISDINIDMRIRDFVVESCFEVTKLSDTESAAFFAKELYRRFILIQFGGYDDNFTEWDNFICAFVSVLQSCGYIVTTKNVETMNKKSEKISSSHTKEYSKLLSSCNIEDCFLDNSNLNDISHYYVGSKCYISYDRINDIIKKASEHLKKIDFIKKKKRGCDNLFIDRFECKDRELLIALKELYPHFQRLHQSLQIRTFHKNNSLLFSEFMTMVSYVLERLDLVSYYSVSSNTIFPFYVSKTRTLSQQNNFKDIDKRINVSLTYPNLSTQLINEEHIDIFDYVSSSINLPIGKNTPEEPSKFPINSFRNMYPPLIMSHPTVSHPIIHLQTICSLADANKLIENYNETAESIFHLLKEDVLNGKLTTLHPGLIYFILCLREKLKNMQLELNDPSLYSVIDRDDLALNNMILKKGATVAEVLPIVNTEMNEGPHTYGEISTNFYKSDNKDDGIYPLVKSSLVQAIFCNDKRIHEVRKMLQSSYPAHLTEVDISHIKFTMEGDSDWTIEQSQLSTLLSLSQRTLALPIGRAALTLGTIMPISVKKIPIPALVVSANLPPNNTIVVLESNKTDKGFFYWPRFHSGVAAGMSISSNWKTLDSAWIVYNRDQNQEVESECLESQHAGFLFGLGLTGRLKRMDIVDLVEYLNNNEGFIALGLIIGLAASYISTGDKKLTRLCHLHIEPNIPKQFDASCENLIKPSAVISLGLLYMERPERSHVISVINLFISSIEASESDITEDQRSALTLSCGFALGYMLLGKMNTKDVGCVANLNIPDLLIEYATCQNFGSVSSISSLIALGLMYLKTNNELIAGRMASLCDKNSIYYNSHKDVKLYATLCKNLIMWDQINPTREWIEGNIPESYQKSFQGMQKSIIEEKISPSYNDAVLYITAGACMALAIKYAGTFDLRAKDVLLEYVKASTRLFYMKAIKQTDRLKKAAAKASLNFILNAASIVLAGSGNLELMRIMRKLHYRRFQEIGYGDQMALHLSLGFLFLGGGTCTFKKNNVSVAGILTSIFAIYPDSTADNFLHMQSLRHFWVLSVENRCLVTREVDSGDICNLHIEVKFKQGTSEPLELKSPCILPEIDKISEIVITGPYVWPLKIFSEDIPRYGWDTRLNCITILVKRIFEGWDIDRSISDSYKKSVLGDIRSKMEYSMKDKCVNAERFLVPKKKETYPNIVNKKELGFVEYRKQYKDVERTVIPNVIEDLSNNIYGLSTSTKSVLEYCLSENKLMLVPLFLCIRYKLENLEERLDVEFVKTMRIISSLLQRYGNKNTQEDTKCPLSAEKFLNYADSSLVEFMRKLDISSPQLLDTQNITSPTQSTSHAHQSAYIVHRNWALGLTPMHIAELYAQGGESNVFMYLRRRYKSDPISFHAFRQMYNLG